MHKAVNADVTRTIKRNRSKHHNRTMKRRAARREDISQVLPCTPNISLTPLPTKPQKSSGIRKIPGLSRSKLNFKCVGPIAASYQSKIPQSINSMSVFAHGDKLT